MTPGQGASIRIINNPKDFNCRYIAVVSGTHTTGLNSAEDIQSTIHLARNKAYDIGANAIRIINGDAIESDGAVFAEALWCDFSQ